MENNDKSLNLLNKAYKCKSSDLEFLLEKIELAIKNSDSPDKILLRAKLVVTSKMAVNK
ncbi:hypothetical protein [Methanobacterium oryzae]|uniref:hypothetical protein n=1 Tax=Methanobacterium oryzae TaxID=69540 RepID=UPI003D2310C3